MAFCVGHAGQLWAWERYGLMPPARHLGLRHWLEGLCSWRQQLPTARQLWALHWMLPLQPAGSRQDPVIGCICFLAVSDPERWPWCRARAACPLRLPRLQGSTTQGQPHGLRSTGAKRTGCRTYRSDCPLWTRCQSSLCTSCRHHQPQLLRLRSEGWPLPTWWPRGRKPAGTRASPLHPQPHDCTLCTPRCSLACSPSPSSSCLPRYSGWL